MHEASLHARNAFLTLTYDDAHLPASGSLQVRDLQVFHRKLRKDLYPHRYYDAGEYGEQTHRPHYHCCIFGQDFLHDAKRIGTGSNGDPLYESETLRHYWPHGHNTVGELTRESASYVARYVMKKTSGKRVKVNEFGEAVYDRVDKQSGEITTIKPEFAVMSLKPGIGEGWINRFNEETYTEDCCFLEGRKVKVPKYYDKLLEKNDPNEFQRIKEQRRNKADRPKVRENNTEKRLRVREELALHKTNRYRLRNESEAELK